MKVKYRGYVIIQSKDNKHISIYENNSLVFHLNLDIERFFDEDELKAIIDIFMFDNQFL